MGELGHVLLALLIFGGVLGAGRKAVGTLERALPSGARQRSQQARQRIGAAVTSTRAGAAAVAARTAVRRAVKGDGRPLMRRLVMRYDPLPDRPQPRPAKAPAAAQPARKPQEERPVTTPNGGGNVRSFPGGTTAPPAPSAQPGHLGGQQAQQPRHASPPLTGASGAGSDMFAAMNSLVARAASGNAADKLKIMTILTEVMERAANAVHGMAVRLSEPDQHYPPNVWEPLMQAGAHCKASAMSVQDSVSALMALLNRPLNESWGQVPHHDEFNRGV